MRNLFRATPECFSMRRAANGSSTYSHGCCAISGGYPKFLDTALVLPIEDHFPDRGMSGHAGRRGAVSPRARSCRHGRLALRGGTRTAARTRATVGPRSRLHLQARRCCEPCRLAARLHTSWRGYLVETFEEPAPGGEVLHEPAIELSAVFMGFGVFMANSAIDHALRAQ